MALSLYQVPPHTKSSHRKSRRFIKNCTARKVRRLGKQLLQDAPTRVIKGYAD
jgi:hypothetical protein